MARTLQPEHDAQIDDLMGLGEYETANEVIADAMNLLAARLTGNKSWAAIAQAEQEIERGEGVRWTQELSRQRREAVLQRADWSSASSPDV